MTATISVAYTKWDGSLHWHFTMFPLGEDDHGLWLGAPDGTAVTRGTETPIRSPAFALLIPRSGWWTSVWNEATSDGTGFSFEVYADVCTPPERKGDVVDAIDLDLDVARHRDGSTILLDEDEFEDHRRAYAYPPRVVDQARAAAAELFGRVEDRLEPFGSTGERWLTRAVALG